MNYEQAFAVLLMEGWLSLEPGSIGTLRVAHDDWCPVMDGAHTRECNCSPEFSVEVKP